MPVAVTSNFQTLHVGSQAVQRHYDPDEMGELTVAIVFAIAEAAGVSPTEMESPPLYTVIDASALENTSSGRI